MRQEVILSDLGRLCQPQAHITNQKRKDLWYACAYETARIKGTMLVSAGNGAPADLVLPLSLEGWYKIYVGLYAIPYAGSEVGIKLSSDEAYITVGACLERTFAEHIVEDVFWRCADLSGQNIEIAKYLSEGFSKDAMIAWFRFVPMSETEVEVYQADKARTDTKRIYATNDMHCMLCWYDMRRENAWKSVAQGYKDTDVEWLAIEDLSHNNGEVVGCEVDEFVFDREIDKSFYKGIRTHYSDDTLREVVEYGHKLGLKMCISNRVAFWCSEYPYDGSYFDQKFTALHPEYRCVDRDGDVTEYLSFLYPEVQEYLVEGFARVAALGCDAVQPIFSRGWPYVLFEEPFLALFRERYGEDARVLPLDDERILALKCEIMTGFLRKLRNRLDKVAEETGRSRVELHAKVLFSVYDNRLMGLDLETWAKEGLVDLIVSDERRVREILPESVFTDSSRRKIDLVKYSLLANEQEKSPVRYDYDSIFAPEVDSKGVLRGPATQKERIREFMELEHRYGMKVYIEIMPRAMSPERIREKALEIYEAGGEHIGLWDTYGRVSNLAQWSMWSRIGHKEELDGYESGEGELFKPVRLLSIGGRNVRSYRSIWGG